MRVEQAVARETAAREAGGTRASFSSTPAIAFLSGLVSGVPSFPHIDHGVPAPTKIGRRGGMSSR